jgi:hypothetical protein
MNSSSAQPRFCSILAAAAFLLLLAVPAVPARAQKASDAVKPVVTIDGSVEPDRIPDWILWRELMSVAAMLADKASDSGGDIWVNRLGLSQAQMNNLIAEGRALRDDEKLIDSDVKGIITAAGGNLDGPTKSRLFQIQADKESRVLVRRDALRALIGKDAYLRLQSFALLRIAPTIKVGTMVPDGK